MLSQDGLRVLLRRKYPEATPHGFRSSFRDWAADETDYPAEVAEHALAHLEGSADGAVVSQDGHVREAAWADGGLGGLHRGLTRRAL